MDISKGLPNRIHEVIHVAYFLQLKGFNLYLVKAA